VIPKKHSDISKASTKRIGKYYTTGATA
jgi:hypothetical protein